MTRVEVGVSQGELLAALARAGSPPPHIDVTTPGWLAVGFEASGRSFVARFPAGDPSPQAQRDLWRRVLVVVRGHVTAVGCGADVVEAGMPLPSPPCAEHRPAAPRRPAPAYQPPLPPPPPARRWNPLTGRRPLPGRVELPRGH